MLKRRTRTGKEVNEGVQTVYGRRRRIGEDRMERRRLMEGRKEIWKEGKGKTAIEGRRRMVKEESKIRENEEEI